MAYVDSITVPSQLRNKSLIIAAHHKSLNRAKYDTRTWSLDGDSDWTGTRPVRGSPSDSIYQRSADNQQPTPWTNPAVAQDAKAVLALPGLGFVTFEVAGISQDYNNLQCHLKVMAAGVGVPKGTVVAKTAIATVSNGAATLEIEAPQAGIPVGLWGLFYFQLSVEGHGDVDTESTPVEIEIYAVSVGELPPVIFDLGLPLSLLRMFALPVFKQGLQTQADYVKLVTQIVHGSARPFTGERSDTRDHWLKYDSGSGSYSFTSALGDSGLNLGAWLDAWRLYDQNSIITTVNCYDQAAATEVALTLGIPHRQVHWEYHRVFGFINKGTQLVGWGGCNNPYFGDNIQRMTVDNNDAQRWPFRNHGYLSWTSKPMTKDMYTEYNTTMETLMTTWDKQTTDAQTLYLQYLSAAAAFEAKYGLDMKMIDACAGPHIGTESRQAYEAQKVLVALPYAGAAQPYQTVWRSYESVASLWNSQHSLSAGVSKLSEEGSYILDLALGTVYDNAFDKVSNILTQSPAPGSGPWIGEQIDEFLSQLFAWIVEQSSKIAALKGGSIRPYSSDAGAEVREIKFSNDATSVVSNSVVVQAPLYLSIKIHQYEDGATATEQLSKHLAMLALTTGLDVGDHTSSLGADPKVKIEGSTGNVAWAPANLAVEIAGSQQFMQDIGWLVQHTVAEMGVPRS